MKKQNEITQVVTSEDKKENLKAFLFDGRTELSERLKDEIAGAFLLGHSGVRGW